MKIPSIPRPNTNSKGRKSNAQFPKVRTSQPKRSYAAKFVKARGSARSR